VAFPGSFQVALRERSTSPGELPVRGFFSVPRLPEMTASRPGRYLATLIGVTDEVAMRYFILRYFIPVVALLLDTAAALLPLASGRAHRKGQPARAAPLAINNRTKVAVLVAQRRD
jgi:hypothetical protein